MKIIFFTGVFLLLSAIGISQDSQQIFNKFEYNPKTKQTHTEFLIYNFNPESQLLQVKQLIESLSGVDSVFVNSTPQKNNFYECNLVYNASFSVENLKNSLSQINIYVSVRSFLYADEKERESAIYQENQFRKTLINPTK